MRNTHRNYVALLNVAEDLFARYGYDKTSVEDIAAGIGKSKTSIYYYFLGKQDMLKAVIEKEFTTIEKEFAAKTEGVIDRDSFYEYLSTRMDMFRNARVYRQFLSMDIFSENREVAEILAQVREPFDRMEREYFESVCTECVKHGLFDAKIDPEAFAGMLVTLLRGYELQFVNAENYEKLEETYRYALRFIIYHKQ